MASILKVSKEECIDILNEFYEMFPTVKEFTLGNEELAKKYGYVEDYMGRRRHLQDINLPQIKVKATKDEPINGSVFIDEDINDILKIEDKDAEKFWTDKYNKDNKKYSYDNKVKFKEEAKANGIDVFDNGAFISKTLTQCTNSRIQGSAASLTKKAMVAIANNSRLQELGFRLLIPVHDELLGECPAIYADEVEKLLAQTMIDAGKPECSVNMKVDTYRVKYWYSDEVENAIHEAFVEYRDGSEKKGIQAIGAKVAYNKLIEKYSELSPETVRLMCDAKFDHENGTL